MTNLTIFPNPGRAPSTATINIHNLRLRTFIGFNPEETEKQQDVVINIEINYILPDSVMRDQVEGALNYKVIAKKVIGHVEEGRFLLLGANLGARHYARKLHEAGARLPRFLVEND